MSPLSTRHIHHPPSFADAVSPGPWPPTHSHAANRQRLFQAVRPLGKTHVNCTDPSYPPRRPGDYLRPGEDEVEGLKRRLDERLTPQTMTGEFDVSGPGHEGQGGGDWEIGEVLSTWYRPAFESYMVSRMGPRRGRCGRDDGIASRRCRSTTSLACHPSSIKRLEASAHPHLL